MNEEKKYKKLEKEIELIQKKLKRSEANRFQLQEIKDSNQSFLNKLYIEVENSRNIIEKQKEELEDSNKELFELNQLKNKFLGMAAHDLRNPLGIIRSFSEILMEDAEDALNGEQRDWLSIIYRTSDKMLDLINELLDISVIESGKLDLKLKPGSLKELLEECVRIGQTLAERKKIRLHTTFSKIRQSLFDENRLNQAVDNLLSNAIKFSPLDTDIYISMEQEGDIAKVKVRDQGPGLSKEDQTKLFGEFQKLSARPTADESSTGLGLSIVKKIINAHNGNVWVESTLGAGATFIFTLPLEK